MIKDENYYTVQGWMRNRLHLKGNDLHVYAMLYSFSQDGQSEFRGTIDYMGDFTGAANYTIRKSLNRLEGRGLIEKTFYNAKTGKTNGFKCVPLDKLDRVLKTSTPVAKNEHPPLLKTSTPVAKNEHPIPYINTDNKVSILKEYKKERKKYIKKESENACARDVPEFEKMSLEDLVTWGETNTVDFEDESSVECFQRYFDEMDKRGSAPTWLGKIIRADGQFIRMKSHAQILTDQGVSIGLREELLDWLRSCYKNGHLVTNAQLESTIFRLQERYGVDERSMCDVVRNATESGYVRIVV